MAVTSNVLVTAAGIVALVALLIFLNAVFTARRGQRAAYYGVRRETQRIANRRLSLAFLTLVLAGGMYGASFIWPSIGPFGSILVTPTPLLAQAQLPTSVSTLRPTTKPTATRVIATATAKITTTIAPKATPIPEPTSLLISATATSTVTAVQSPLATPGPAAPNKRLTLLAVASGVDAQGAPVDAGTSFSVGTKSIYIFFGYRDVPPSALLRHSWFRNGGSVYYNSQRLLGQSATGTSLLQWSPQGGMRAGLYEVRVQLGGVQQFVANFEVR